MACLYSRNAIEYLLHRDTETQRHRETHKTHHYSKDDMGHLLQTHRHNDTQTHRHTVAHMAHPYRRDAIEHLLDAMGQSL